MVRQMFPYRGWALGWAVAVCAMMGATGAALADTIAVHVGGSQNIFYSQSVVGWQFAVTEPVTVTSLGYYQVGASLMDNHDVGIYGPDGALLAFATVNPSDPLVVDGFRFHNIDPVVLPPASDYRIAAVPSPNDVWAWAFSDFSSSDPVSYVVNRATPGANTLVYPQSITSPADQAYFGPNFLFSVPEPASLYLLTLAALPLLRRRR